MSKTTASADGGAMPAEGNKTRLLALRAAIEKALGEMDLPLDGLSAVERAMLADAITETLLKSPLFAGVTTEELANV
jgi:hypothetical protein